MTYKNFLVIASKADRAGMNIASQLNQFKDANANFNFHLINDSVLHKENLDLELINKHDFIVFASKHVSKAKEKALCIHAPGNWRLNEFGGEKRKVCKTSAYFIKQFFEKLHEQAKTHHLKDYKLTMEATHHGPLIDKPCVFIEVGSTETEWSDRKAGFVLATTLKETFKNFKPNPYNEIAIAIGGPHYCPNFNKIQAKYNTAISHVISQYSFPLEEEMVQEAIDKTEEEIDYVLLDWKGLGNSEQRQKILDILNSLKLDYRKTSDVKN